MSRSTGGNWLVVVDVAPDSLRRRTDRTLRDLGFSEVFPCVYVSMWGSRSRRDLELTLRRIARARGNGRVAAYPLRAGDPVTALVRQGLNNGNGDGQSKSR